MKSFDVGMARRAFVHARTYKPNECTLSWYKSHGFSQKTDIKKIEIYIPIINQIENQCDIQIGSVIDIETTNFENWLEYIEKNENS